jgi:uncharacterized protein YkwD
MMRILLAVVLCLLAPSLAFAQVDWRDNLVAHHNAQRAGLPALVRDARLDRAAQLHAENMSRQQKMAHVLDGRGVGARVCAEGICRFGVGENIAMGQRSTGDVMRAWMVSPGHRDNIQGRYRFIGVGYSNGFWCVVFAR